MLPLLVHQAIKVTITGSVKVIDTKK